MVSACILHQNDFLDWGLVTHLLSDHIHSILNSTVRNQRDNGRIHDAKILHAVDAQLRVHNAVCNVLGQSGRAAGVYDVNID